FQAEDGIRDFHVTGVQTCALPILEYYDAKLLTTIVLRSAHILNTPIDEVAAYEIARRSRGTPRIANMLLRRTRDFAEIKGDGTRSEERRVGKEDRTSGGPYHENKR